MHNVVATDYNQYAIVYGCDSYFAFYQGWYATLLSRTPQIGYQETTAAMNFLDNYGYNASLWWVSAGSGCGWGYYSKVEAINTMI